ncbi:MULTISPECIES: glycosyltransferase family 39 protein [unclassified Rhizobium]|uniref:glycosyltransferase family 39 protein n=1 Tax=unclassified Rhizobium TaxID=2613769 RepID=UPI0021F79D8E|nr:MULTISPECIES: glycosyltransferase family 39 protein [unclassified Rhizobium]MCV9943549.1 glycosyltransferase family 39 protein [Rhizobium sp. BT-175]MCW0017115.1 glycosyltransferase family 39 protein [Rhizobium sp. BT-226]
MLERVTRTIKTAGLLLAAYFVLNIALRIALPHSLELDEAEQSFFSQYLLAGYGPQPPFYNWMQYAVVSLTGMSIGTLIVPKNILLFLSYLFYGFAGRRALKDEALAAVGMLALITLPQVSYMAQQDLTHTTALLFASSLFLYGFFRTLDRPDMASYLLLGLATGIGLISKYNFALMPVVALIAILPDAEWRRRALDWRILVAVAVALLIVLPHAIWLQGNLAFASSDTLVKMAAGSEPAGALRIGKGLLAFLVAIIAFAALPVVIFAATFRRDFVRALSAGNRWTGMMERMMLASLAGIALIVLFTGSTTVRERWLDPFLMVLPIYFLAKMQAAGLDLSAGLRRFRPVLPVLMACVLIALGFRVVGAGLIGTYSRPNVPMAVFSREMTRQAEPALVIASDTYIGGNMRLQFPDVPVVIPDFPAPGIPAYAEVRGPVLIVWRGKKTATAADAVMPERFSSALTAAGIALQEIGSLSLPYYFGRQGDNFALGYAWVQPETK